MATKKIPIKAHGRSLGDFPNLSAIEKSLIASCRIGVPLLISDGTRPEKSTDVNTIRAGLIRFLLLGGDAEHPVHEIGVQIFGAWIEDTVYLQFCRCKVALSMFNSTFVEIMHLVDCTIPSLVLINCQVPGINADRAVIKGSLHLRQGFKATGEIRLLKVRIGSDLDCHNASFNGNDSNVLNAAGANIGGSVFLDRGFKAVGTVNFSYARIGGAFSCRNASLRDTTGTALDAYKAQIKGSVFFGQGCKIQGTVDFDGAKFGSLIDDPLAAPQLRLDGFTYTSLGGIASADAETRITWLNRQPSEHLGSDFRPQPWEQLINVLRDMGHEDGADKVAIAKQDALFKAGKIKGAAKIWQKLYGWLAGYGYRPINTIIAMLFVLLFAGDVFLWADGIGLMGPSSAIIQSNRDIAAACGKGTKNRETLWTRCDALPQTYTTFNPYWYSLDLILPLVDLQQDKDWSPIVSSGKGEIIWSGIIIRTVMQFEILFGWMASLLLVAVLGNLVKKD